MVNLTECFFSRLLKETVANFIVEHYNNMTCLKFLNITDFLVCIIIERVSSLTIFTPCIQKKDLALLSLSEWLVHLYFILRVSNQAVRLLWGAFRASLGREGTTTEFHSSTSRTPLVDY